MNQFLKIQIRTVLTPQPPPLIIPRPVKNRLARLVALSLFLLFTVPLSATEFDTSAEPPVGAQCSLWMRKDAWANGELKFVGRIVAVHPNWVVIKSDKQDIWVPRALVAFIEITPS